MRISQVILKNFRNFCDATINLNDKTLIIGSNDVGKTNLLYALRLLLDRTLSEADIEPTDSDFYAYEDVSEFSISLRFQELTDNIKARFKECCKHDALYLVYKAERDAKSGKVSHQIYAGPSLNEDELQALEARTYLRTLNIRYVSSSRNLASYIKKQKKYLLQEAKEERTPDEVDQDTVIQEKVRTDLEEINADIEKMSYIQKATTGINEELKELSIHHESQKVVFEVGANDPAVFIDGAHLASQVNSRHLTIDGDGRNNQIFLSLWATRNKLNSDDEPVESIICAIEEPEAHLHPHQQRKLAQYLSTNLNTQVIITSHSPQIASKFAPNAIVRLKSQSLKSSAASEGCTPGVTSAFVRFGHRLNAISSEAFFADVVFLVEGPSEVLFYKALAAQIGIDLDRYNISILPVTGVGFESYTQILDALEIDYVIRTDNDIFKIPQSKKDPSPPRYRLAGLQRGLSLCLEYMGYDTKTPEDIQEEEIQRLVDNRDKLSQLASNDHADITDDEFALIEDYASVLEDWNIFIADIDLENDILYGPLEAEVTAFIQEYEEKEQVSEPLKSMQKNKATFMYNFLMAKEDSLKALNDDPIATPLHRCVEIATENLKIEQADETHSAAAADH